VGLRRLQTSGPVFLTDRRARVPLPQGDVDQATGRARLSYTHAEALFKAPSSGATLQQPCHSAITHEAEDGTSTPMLMARSGHTSVRSLAKYARVSAESLQRHQAERDPARRRRDDHVAHRKHLLVTGSVFAAVSSRRIAALSAA
jgi:hypothetical protein